ncbi:muramoyltetrapeptide carboxypeptidase [Atlantibacter hermannii]|uniref:muramoyltetrapeptide carboxypeptidase n=1 Tax=Atlantibacter hermannii TaxID=565 RepID=UPI00289B2980|nr:muramoyltetrapeptide carboxypeptidase [Atlantibacter hermannii]
MSRIHLIAPSGYCVAQDAARRGVARLTEAGHTVGNHAVISRRFQRFAGDDATRLNDINQLATLGDADIVLAVRGGYGVTRLLENIDYSAIAARLRKDPLIICGHSDFSAVQLQLLATEQAITFCGPMLAGNFGAPEMNAFTWTHFWQAVTSPEFTLRWETASADCRAQGTLWGGNLAMICSLLGTPWMPDIEGGILVVEDINEHPYRIERMLLQLHQAGVLNRQHALILGSFSASKPNEYDDGYDLAAMTDALRQRIAIPIINGLDFGHEQRTVTLPLGASGVLHCRNGQASLTVMGHPTVNNSGNNHSQP